MRPTDLKQRLNRLAELAKGKGDLQRVLENVDVIAQEALDATTTYVNKKGQAVTYESPNWATVLQAQKLAAQLLGLLDQSDKKKPEGVDKGKESDVIQAIRAEGLRVAK